MDTCCPLRLFGRYSLDKAGLILASQGQTLTDYARLTAPDASATTHRSSLLSLPMPTISFPFRTTTDLPTTLWPVFGRLSGPPSPEQILNSVKHDVYRRMPRHGHSQVVYPLTTQPLALDLDDGVLVNYNRFGATLAPAK
jgi:hypothetical protein